MSIKRPSSIHRQPPDYAKIASFSKGADDTQTESDQHAGSGQAARTDKGPRQTRSQAAPSKPKKDTPWSNARSDVKKAISVALSEEHMLKLDWLARNHIPQSKRGFIAEVAAKAIDQKIKELEKK